MKIRERDIVFCLVISLLFSMAIPCYAQLQNSAWPGFKRDISHTGRTPYIGPTHPLLKWTYPVNVSEWAGVSIDNSGTIYVGTGQGDHSLYAIDQDGNLKWNYTWLTSDSSAGTPAINQDGTIYITQTGINEVDWAGRVHAVNPDSTSKWIYKVSGVSGTWMVTSPSVDVDGTIYIPDFANSPYRGGLSAINPDGTLKWYYGISTSGTERDPKSAVAIDDERGHLYFGASAKTGDNRLLALDRSGQPLWAYTTGGPISESPAIDDEGTVYFGSQDGKLYALYPNGNLKWSFATGAAIIFSPCIGWDNTIYVGSTDGNLYALNPDGSLKWSFKTGGSIYCSAAVDGNNYVYFGSTDKNFYSLAPDGTMRWKFSTQNNILTYPAIGEDRTVYFICRDGYLYALTEDYCEGDFDSDGDVDGSDLALFSSDFGRTDCPAQNMAGLINELEARNVALKAENQAVKDKDKESQALVEKLMIQNKELLKRIQVLESRP